MKNNTKNQTKNIIDQLKVLFPDYIIDCPVIMKLLDLCDENSKFSFTTEFKGDATIPFRTFIPIVNVNIKYDNFSKQGHYGVVSYENNMYKLYKIISPDIKFSDSIYKELFIDETSKK